MANIRWNCSLTPYHKKESVTYLIKKINSYKKSLAQANAPAMLCEHVARTIAKDTYDTYKTAKYDGSLVVRLGGNTTPRSGGGGAYQDRYALFDSGNATKTVWVYSSPIGGRVIYEPSGVYLYTKWAVTVTGLGAFLEFGTGDKFSGGGYARIFNTLSLYYRSPSAVHFVSKYNGLDTWVYKGEVGTNPATRHNQVYDRQGNPRVGYYYSQGNYPTRGLYNAVRKFRRSPTNLRDIINKIRFAWKELR